MGTMSAQWAVDLSPDESSVHVHPVGDAVLHTWEDCHCGPHVSYADTLPLHTHMSLDGRDKDDPYGDRWNR